MKIAFLNDNGTVWNDFVEKSDMGSVFQSYEWNIQQKRDKWSHDLMVVEEDGQIRGGAMLYWKKTPLLNRTVSKISYGPVWNNDRNILNRLSEEIIKNEKERKAIFLEFQVYLPEYINGEKVAETSYVDDILLSHGFRRMPNRIGTYRIDLERDEDVLLGGFDKDHRRDIRKGMKEGVQIKDCDDPAMVDIFYEYYSNLFRQKNLVPLPKDFFAGGLTSLLQENRCKLFYAEYEGKIHNMAVISLFGNPMYVWGASIRSEKKPPMGQLLHWEIIRWLKEKKYKIYDLGGSPGEIPRKDHPNYWVWRFKKGFNGEYVEFLSPYRYVFSEGQYWLYERMLPIYRKCLLRATTKNQVENR